MKSHRCSHITADAGEKAMRRLLKSNSGEGYINTVLVIIICVVVGAVILGGLFLLFKAVVLPNTSDKIEQMINTGSGIQLRRGSAGIEYSYNGTSWKACAVTGIRVITSTTSKGIDKADIKDNAQPLTVTLLVNQAQAELLAQYEKTASMHFALEYRGDAAVAQKYLEAQDAYFTGKGN